MKYSDHISLNSPCFCFLIVYNNDVKKSLYILIFLLALSLSVLADWRIEVKEIYDGDTITADIYLGLGVVLTNQKIRLLYIDAPELKGKGVDDVERVRGYEAKEYLISLLKDKEVHLFIDPKEKERDSFGRILGILKVDGISINDRMISEGHAVPFDK